MRRDEEDREEIRGLVVVEESFDAVMGSLKRKGLPYDKAGSFDEAMDLASRNAYTLAFLELGMKDFMPMSWVELIELVGMDTRLFCIAAGPLDDDLRVRLLEGKAVMLDPPIDQDLISKKLSDIVRESSASIEVPPGLKRRGPPRMRGSEED